MDSWRAPRGILFCHEVDGGANLAIDPSPAPGSARAKTPVESKPAPVPTHDRLRLDDEDRALPSPPERRQSYPEQPVAARQMWAWTLPLEHRELLSQGKDLQAKVVPGVKEHADIGKEREEELEH